MVRGLLSALIAIPLALLVVLFAVSNRAPIAVELFPLPDQLVLPLYLLVLPLVALSFLLGALLMWVLGHPARALARREAVRAQKLEKELANLRVAALGLDAPPASGSRTALVSSAV
jgi:putative membrane protein